jgi:hypothetical protein
MVVAPNHAAQVDRANATWSGDYAALAQWTSC